MRATLNNILKSNFLSTKRFKLATALSTLQVSDLNYNTATS